MSDLAEAIMQQLDEQAKASKARQEALHGPEVVALIASVMRAHTISGVPANKRKQVEHEIVGAKSTGEES